jgi:hypothetical protein
VTAIAVFFLELRRAFFGLGRRCQHRLRGFHRACSADDVDRQAEGGEFDFCNADRIAAMTSTSPTLSPALARKGKIEGRSSLTDGELRSAEKLCHVGTV